MDIYKQIKTRESYDKLLHSGMFWEFHPELTGVWGEDRLLIHAEQPKKYKTIVTQNKNHATRIRRNYKRPERL